MAKRATSSIPSEPNFISDEVATAGYFLDLRAIGRSEKTLKTSSESLKSLRRFCAERGMPPLVALSTEHLREFFNHRYSLGNKPSTVSVRYRGLQQF